MRICPESPSCSDPTLTWSFLTQWAFRRANLQDIRADPEPKLSLLLLPNWSYPSIISWQSYRTTWEWSQIRGMDHSSVGTGLPIQAWGHELSPQHPCKKSGMVFCVCNPSAGEVGTGGSLGLPDQSLLISKHQVTCYWCILGKWKSLSSVVNPLMHQVLKKSSKLMVTYMALVKFNRPWSKTKDMNVAKGQDWGGREMRWGVIVLYETYTYRKLSRNKFNKWFLF